MLIYGYIHTPKKNYFNVITPSLKFNYMKSKQGSEVITEWYTLSLGLLLWEFEITLEVTHDEKSRLL